MAFFLFVVQPAPDARLSSNLADVQLAAEALSGLLGREQERGVEAEGSTKLPRKSRRFSGAPTGGGVFKPKPVSA